MSIVKHNSVKIDITKIFALVLSPMAKSFQAVVRVPTAVLKFQLFVT